MVGMRIIFFLFLFFSGCTSSSQKSDEVLTTSEADGTSGSDGSAGSSGSAGSAGSVKAGSAGSRDSADVPGSAASAGSGGTLHPDAPAAEENGCDSEGVVRDPGAGEYGEYCICKYHETWKFLRWECYGAPEDNQPFRAEKCGAPGVHTGDDPVEGCSTVWECDDGIVYAFICVNGNCACQIRGVTRTDLGRLEDPLETCTYDATVVNAQCSFWTE